MTAGVGGKTKEEALAGLADMTQDVTPISVDDYKQRLSTLQEKMKLSKVAAIYLHGGTNLYYFTGLKWSPSERMVAAVITQSAVHYICPRFELDTLNDFLQIEGQIHTWEEHESPYELFGQVLNENAGPGSIAIDEVTPYFIVDGIQKANSELELIHAQPLTQEIRSRKSPKEIAIIKRAHEMTLEVHKAAAAILCEGISTVEVESFIDEAHRIVGAPAGSFFCIVLFGVPTSFPHGVKDPQSLKQDDWVLIDTGCLLDGYNSDITRSFCFGTPTEEHRRIFEIERNAQIAAFEAAKLGAPCEVCDAAARVVIEAAGLGPDYQLPGLPHRTGHGCGLDIHEGPNLVRGEKTPLEVGMVFSSEPMIVVPDAFGVRLEDHFFMSDTGPTWFTEPSPSIDDPFGLS